VSPADPLFLEPADEETDALSFLLTPTRTPDGVEGGQVLEVSQILGRDVVDVRLFGGDAEVEAADLPPTLNGQPGPFCAPEELLHGPRASLFRRGERGWVCTFHERWGGFVQRGEVRVPLGELRLSGVATRTPDGRWETSLRPGEVLVLDLGRTVFVARETARPRRLVDRVRDRLDPTALALFAFMFVTFGLVGLALGVVPPPPTVAMNADIDRAVDIDLMKLLPPPPTPTVTPAREAAPAAGRAAQAEGRSGGGRREGTRDHEVGILTDLMHDDMFAKLRAGTLDGGIVKGIQGLVGSRGASDGPGLGWRGNGPGAGGRVEDGTGLAFNTNRDGARELASGGRGPKAEGVIIVGDTSTVLGRYDRSLVDGVVKRNLAAIRYCYQREVNLNPSLAGKVTVRFTIAADGSVSSATTKSSTLNSPAVETCINGRFMRMSFPAPTSGLVIVTYPFMFST